MSLAKEAGVAVAVTAAGVAAEIAFLELNTTSFLHRDNTHESLGMDPRLEAASNVLMTPYTEPGPWAATHLTHHSVPDANLLPFIEVADHHDWLEENPTAERPKLPEAFDNLDPVAREIPYETVVKIGQAGRQLVLGRYVPEEYYTPERTAAVLDTKGLRYAYKDIDERAKRPSPKNWGDRKPTLDDMAYRLMDPHSPSLLEEGADFWVFAKKMLKLYKASERMYDSNDQLPPHLARDPRQEHRYETRKARLVGYSTAHVLGAIGIGLAKGQTEPLKVVRNALIGGGIAAGGGYGLVAGGIIVNYTGHLGKYPADAIRTHKVTPHENGSLATNANWLLGVLTADEAGDQYNHHNHPDWLDFSGGRGWLRAPMGTFLNKTAEARRLGLSPGKQFPGSDHRPDQLHPAVQMIHDQRVETMARAA